MCKQIALACVDAGLDLHQTQDGGEQGIVIGVLTGAVTQAGFIQAAIARELRREPHHHRHVGLLLGRDCIRHPMQIQAFFAKRFTMIGDVDHRGVVAAQRVDGLIEEMVGIADGIVVGVDDVLAAAAAQIGGFTYRFEASERPRVAFEVTWSMAAQLMQHHDA
ncbi:hypothetical protein XGA_2631, partial [Xanthomonas hortorum ATCC 19865]